MSSNSATFDSIEPGDELPPVALDLDPGFVRAHAVAIDMDAPRFTNSEGAQKEGLPGQITPGNMSLGLLARALLAWHPSARLERIGTTFRGLALAGSRASLHAMVTEKDEDRHTIECDVWMESEGGDRTVIGTATLAFDPVA